MYQADVEFKKYVLKYGKTSTYFYGYCHKGLLAGVVKYADYFSGSGVKGSCILQYAIWRWGFSSGALENVEYPFIAITLMSTRTYCSSIY